MSTDSAFEIQFFESVLRRHAKDVRALTQLGHLYTRHGLIDEGLYVDRRLVRLRPKDPLAHYNLACSFSLKRMKSQAIRSLRRAVELGYNDPEYLYEDPDLAGLHGLKAFHGLLHDMRCSCKRRCLKNGYFLS